MRTAAEIKALQIAAGTYKEPVITPAEKAPLTLLEASDRHHERMNDLRARLRRYSSISLAQRLELKHRAVAQKGGKCALCGYHRCMKALEFHHRERSSKQFSISNLIGAKVFNCGMEEVWAQVVEELKKCVLLCANCHREVEAGVVDLPDLQ